MKRSLIIILAALGFGMAGASSADDQKLKAVVGGAAGGAVGAAIGEELGDRNGAIVGAAVGAAVGTAIATDGEKSGHDAGPGVTVEKVVVGSSHPQGRHCPPGQAKKGRC